MILTVVVLGCTVTDDDFENVLTASYLPKVGSPGSLGYREIFSIYREICQNS